MQNQFLKFNSKEKECVSSYLKRILMLRVDFTLINFPYGKDVAVCVFYQPSNKAMLAG